jgi:hypothetical protein
MILSGRAISDISLRGLAAILAGVPVTGAGCKHGRRNCDERDNQNSLSHFPGYFN